MTNNVLSLCDYAKSRHKTFVLWRNLFTGLIFGFSTVIILFFATAILLFIRATWLPGAISTVGGIVSGLGIKWVVNRRKEVVEEETKAYEDVKEACGGDTREADEWSKKIKFFGRF